jgi:hypothetical protein
MKNAIIAELDRGPRSRRVLRKILGLQPGPGTKALLKALRELQASRRVYYSLYDDLWCLDEGYVGPPDTYLG